MSLLMQALKKAEHAKQKQGSFAGDEESPVTTEEVLSLTPMELPKEPETEPQIAESADGGPQGIDARINTASLDLAPNAAALESEAGKIEHLPEHAAIVTQPPVTVEQKNLPQQRSALADQTSEHKHGNDAHKDTPAPAPNAKAGAEASAPVKLKIGTEQQQAEIKIAIEQQKAKAVFASKQVPGSRRTMLIGMAGATIFVMLAAFGFLYWQNTMGQATRPFNRTQSLPPQPLPVVAQTAPPASEALPQPAPVSQISPATPVKTDNAGTLQTTGEKTENSANATPANPTQKSVAAMPLPEPEERKPTQTKRSAAATMTADAQAIKVQQSAGSNQVNPVLTRAYQAFLAGDMELATQQYEKVLAQEPNNRDALLGMGAIAIGQKHATEASSYYLKLLEADPADTDAIAGLTSMQYSDSEQSESRLKKIVAQNPNAGPIHFVLGNFYSRQARWADAQQSYFRAYGSAPDNADYAYNLAVSLDRLGQSKLALDYYRKAISLVKDNQENFNKAAIQKRINELSAVTNK